jgi:preprotein translocase subunit SecF
MRIFKQTNIDFLGKRKIWYLISTCFVLIGMISVTFEGISYGIDFQGGTEIVLTFKQKVEISEVRSALEKVGLGKSEIKTYGAANNILIRTAEQGEGTSIADRILGSLKTAMPNDSFEIAKEAKIGPKIGKELRRDALYAIIWSFVAILAYIAIRFKFAYGTGAVLALVHDVFTTLGFITILNHLFPALNLEITLEVIAAFLTLIGVSVNDTVVIFDRIRENVKIYRSMSLNDVMNKSLNETLSRTIITSTTILIVLLILLIFGGEVNRGFAFTLTFGLLTGTYSSIYIASAFVLDWTLYRDRKKAVISPAQHQ